MIVILAGKTVKGNVTINVQETPTKEECLNAPLGGTGGESPQSPLV